MYTGKQSIKHIGGRFSIIESNLVIKIVPRKTAFEEWLTTWDDSVISIFLVSLFLVRTSTHGIQLWAERCYHPILVFDWILLSTKPSFDFFKTTYWNAKGVKGDVRKRLDIKKNPASKCHIWILDLPCWVYSHEISGKDVYFIFGSQLISKGAILNVHTPLCCQRFWLHLS